MNGKFGFMATSYHESTFNALEAMAWARANGESEQAGVFEIGNGEEYCYNLIAKIDLPQGTRSLFHEFAKFSKVAIGPMDGIHGIDLESLPPHTYQLELALLASFPRNARTGILRTPMNGDGEIELQDNEVHRHQAFTGVGVILMREARNILDPLLTDDDTIIMAGKKELLISFI